MTNTITGNLAGCFDRIARGRAIRSALMDLDSTSAPYQQALLDAASLFERLQIPYALVGGIAAMYFGRARFTEDLDIVAATGHMNALTGHPEAMREHHFDPSSTWKLYHDSGVEIDIWKDEHSDEIVQRATIANLAGREIRIAEPHDLIAMKLRAARLQDDYDISEILKRTAIDDNKIRAIVDDPQFQHFEAIKLRMMH